MIAWKRSNDFLTAWGRDIPCTCRVRNEINGQRQAYEVVWSTDTTGGRGFPYQPRQFPLGDWAIGEPTRETDRYLAPYFIPTNAHQLVDEWEITERDRMEYVKRSGFRYYDWAYGLHFSTSITTLGCIRIGDPGDVYFLVDRILAEREKSNPVRIEVSE